jgi:hypothetical protein
MVLLAQSSLIPQRALRTSQSEAELEALRRWGEREQLADTCTKVYITKGLYFR